MKKAVLVIVALVAIVAGVAFFRVPLRLMVAKKPPPSAWQQTP